eukprot:3005017-Alexandrium_andersonii.AAC.1
MLPAQLAPCWLPKRCGSCARQTCGFEAHTPPSLGTEPLADCPRARARRRKCRACAREAASR